MDTTNHDNLGMDKEGVRCSALLEPPELHSAPDRELERGAGVGGVREHYNAEGARIYQGDALEYLRAAPAKSVNVILTDPPFFTPANHYQSRVSWGRSWGDMSILGEFFFQFAMEVKRVLKDDGHLMCFCHDESYPVFYPVAFGMWDFTACLIWDKTRPGLGKIFRHQHEMILWASNSGAHCESDGVLHSDILRHAPTLSRDRSHPVEKPTALMEEILTVIAKPGHVVLDPFMGSGTTLEAAKRRGCLAVGVEMERRYCESAADRLDTTRVEKRVGQGLLFGPLGGGGRGVSVAPIGTTDSGSNARLSNDAP